MTEEMMTKGFYANILAQITATINKSWGYCGGKDSCGPTIESKNNDFCANQENH